MASGGTQSEVIDLSLSDDEAPTNRGTRAGPTPAFKRPLPRAGTASRRDLQRPLRPSFVESIDLDPPPGPAQPRPSGSRISTAKDNRPNLASKPRPSVGPNPGKGSGSQDSQFRHNRSQDRASSRGLNNNDTATVVIDDDEPEQSFRSPRVFDDDSDRQHMTGDRKLPSSDMSLIQTKRPREDDPPSKMVLPEKKRQKFESRALYGSSSAHGGTRGANPSSAQKHAKFQLNEAVSGKKMSLSDSQSSHKMPDSVVDLTGDDPVEPSPPRRRQLGASSTRSSTADARSSPSKVPARRSSPSSDGQQSAALQEQRRIFELGQFQRRGSKDLDGAHATPVTDRSGSNSPKRRKRSPGKTDEQRDGHFFALATSRSSPKSRGSEIPESLPGSPAKSERNLGTEASRQRSPDSYTPYNRGSVADGATSNVPQAQAANISFRSTIQTKHDSDTSQDAPVRQSSAAENERDKASTARDDHNERATLRHSENSGGLTSPITTNGSASPVPKARSLNVAIVATRSPPKKVKPKYPPSPSETTSEENGISRERTPKKARRGSELRKLKDFPEVTLNTSQQIDQRSEALKEALVVTSAAGTDASNHRSGAKVREVTTGQLEPLVTRQSRERKDGHLNSKRSDADRQEIRRPILQTFQRPATDLSNAASREPVMSHDITTAGSSRIPRFPNQSLSNRVEQVVGHYIGQMQRDNEHWARTTLRRARLSVENRPPLDEEQPTDVFSKMQPLTLSSLTKAPSKKPDRLHARFSVEAGKAQTKWAVPCTPIDTSTRDVPSYSHYVSIKNNFLAHNDPTLQHWPYFGDDVNDVEVEQALGRQYSLDIVGREQKILDLAKAETTATYAEDMLEELGCVWSDVLYFLLHQNPLPDVASYSPALQALEKRSSFCKDAFRTSPRWTTLVSSLPEPKQENVEKAALLCDHFHKLLKLSLWHVVRKSVYTRKLLDRQHQSPEMATLTCRVCMRSDCPYHGEIKDTCESQSDSDDASTNSSDTGHEVKTDIVHPPDVNHRSRVAFPPSLETQEAPFSGKDRRSVAYWQTGSMAKLKFQPDERGPFYPCHHPGTSCTTAECSCYRSQIPCEKTCACSPGCSRKFQGCNCASEKTKSGHKLVCFESDTCACFQLGRECDPDLCGDCGVCDVVDPLHKHDDRILIGRCRNANMQRGVAKHTILGDSGVHGLGLYACDTIHQHEFVGEYKGEIIQKDEADRRGAVYEHQKLSYLFSLNNTQEIDSTYFGTKTRFINHAPGTKANLYPRIIMVNAVHRIALFGQRRIASGEELFFDYGPQFPQDQLGGKANKKQIQQSKAAPHVRNAGLVFNFEDVVQDEDELGNVRARPASKAKRPPGRPPRGAGNPKQQSGPRGGARPGAGRPKKVLPPGGLEAPNNDMTLAGRDLDEPELDDYPQDFMLHNIKDDEPEQHRAAESDDEDFQLPSEGSGEDDDEEEEEESESDDEDIQPRGRGRPRLSRS